MKRSAFAMLIGVSKQQVSKYVAGGAVVVADGEVDVQASLALLEGRLDEAKRQRALASLGERRSPQPPNQGSGAKPSARQEKDAVERDLKLLELGQKAGELVLVADVEDAAAQAVAAMREAFSNGRRDLAADICASFGLPPEKASALHRFLGVGFERALGTFAEAMASLAAAPPAPAEHPAQSSPALAAG
jgi:hypothetical protein